MHLMQKTDWDPLLSTSTLDSHLHEDGVSQAGVKNVHEQSETKGKCVGAIPLNVLECM